MLNLVGFTLLSKDTKISIMKKRNAVLTKCNEKLSKNQDCDIFTKSQVILPHLSGVVEPLPDDAVDDEPGDDEAEEEVKLDPAHHLDTGADAQSLVTKTTNIISHITAENCYKYISSLIFINVNKHIQIA